MSLGLGTCRTCGDVVSFNAKVCPRCGTANPAGGSTWSRLAGLLVIGGLIVATAWWLIFVLHIREQVARLDAKPHSKELILIAAAVKKLLDSIDGAMGKQRK